MRREERGPKSRPAEEDGTKWRKERRGGQKKGNKRRK